MERDLAEVGAAYSLLREFDEFLPPTLQRDKLFLSGLDIRDPDHVAFARAIGALPALRDPVQAPRLGAVAFEASARADGATEQGLDLRLMTTLLPLAGAKIVADLERVRRGEALIPGGEQRRRRSARATCRYVARVLAQPTDSDAPLDLNYHGERPAYVRSIRSHLADLTQSPTAQPDGDAPRQRRPRRLRRHGS